MAPAAFQRNIYRPSGEGEWISLNSRACSKLKESPLPLSSLVKSRKGRGAETPLSKDKRKKDSRREQCEIENAIFHYLSGRLKRAVHVRRFFCEVRGAE